MISVLRQNPDTPKMSGNAVSTGVGGLTDLIMALASVTVCNYILAMQGLGLVVIPSPTLTFRKWQLEAESSRLLLRHLIAVAGTILVWGLGTARLVSAIMTSLLCRFARVACLREIASLLSAVSL